MSDRVVVMNGGIAEQAGAPHEIYNRPTTRFVANFVGTLNTVEADVLDPATGRVRLAGQDITLGRPLPAGKVTLGARPEMISLGDHPGRETNLTGTITEVHFLGSVIRIRARVGDGILAFDTFNASDAPPPKIGDEVALSVAARDLLVI